MQQLAFASLRFDLLFGFADHLDDLVTPVLRDTVATSKNWRISNSRDFTTPWS